MYLRRGEWAGHPDKARPSSVTPVDPYHLPRGSELSHVGLHVTPHSGGSGAVVADVRAEHKAGSEFSST